MNVKHHTNAFFIEELLKKEFKADRLDFGGVIDADFIDRDCNFWYCILIALAKYYNPIEKEKIEEFIDKYKDFSGVELKNIPQDDFELFFEELSQLINELKEAE